MKLLTQFKHDIKNAIEAYADKKAGGINNLAAHREAPCRRLQHYLITTDDHWKDIKHTLQGELADLQTGFLGRSKLRRDINKVLTKPYYSNDAFYDDAIKAKDRQISILSGEKRNKTISELNARIFKLNNEVTELKKENEKLKQQLKTVQQQNTQLQKEHEYQQEQSPTNSFCDDYDQFSASSDGGSYNNFSFFNNPPRKTNNVYSPMDIFNEDNVTESPRNT